VEAYNLELEAIVAGRSSGATLAAEEPSTDTSRSADSPKDEERFATPNDPELDLDVGGHRATTTLEKKLLAEKGELKAKIRRLEAEIAGN
jgi:hypothetical protein